MVIISVIKIFIGYDKREVVAYHVLSQSIIKYAKCPISITPLKLDHFSKFYKRKKRKKDSTEFSISRFLTPYLSNFSGYSIYMDCDMLLRDNIAKVFKYIMKNKNKTLWCVKHNHQVENRKKFLNEKQLKYSKKNWSSFMIFNNQKCKILTPKFIEKSHGLYLHQFKWTKDESIGSIGIEWNTLSGYNKIDQKTKNIHFTEGGPYFTKYKKAKGSAEWFKIKEEISK